MGFTKYNWAKRIIGRLIPRVVFALLIVAIPKIADAQNWGETQTIKYLELATLDQKMQVAENLVIFGNLRGSLSPQPAAVQAVSFKIDGYSFYIISKSGDRYYEGEVLWGPANFRPNQLIIRPSKHSLSGDRDLWYTATIKPGFGDSTVFNFQAGRPNGGGWEEISTKDTIPYPSSWSYILLH